MFFPLTAKIKKSPKLQSDFCNVIRIVSVFASSMRIPLKTCSRLLRKLSAIHDALSEEAVWLDQSDLARILFESINFDL